MTQRIAMQNLALHWFKILMQQGMPEPVFYGDLVL